MSHNDGCEWPDIHVVKGITKRLTTCRKCGAQVWGDLR